DDRGREAQLLELRRLVGNRPERTADAALLVVEVAAEAGDAADPEREVELVLLLEPLLLAFGEDAVAEVLSFARGDRRMRDRVQIAMEPDHRGARHGEVERRGAALDHFAKERFDGRHRRAKSRLRATARGACFLRPSRRERQLCVARGGSETPRATQMYAR